MRSKNIFSFVLISIILLNQTYSQYSIKDSSIWATFQNGSSDSYTAKNSDSSYLNWTSSNYSINWDLNLSYKQDFDEDWLFADFDLDDNNPDVDDDGIIDGEDSDMDGDWINDNGNDLDEDWYNDESDVDIDWDQISNEIEDNSPNNWDANSDGIKDSMQTYVSSIINLETNNYNTIESSWNKCIKIKGFESINWDSLSNPNNDDFPLWFWDIEAECSNPWEELDILIYLDKVYDTSSWVYRKYNKATKIYTDISDIVTYSSAIVGWSTVTTVTYSVLDWWPYDDDWVANWFIVDPAWPVILNQTSNNSGNSNSSSSSSSNSSSSSSSSSSRSKLKDQCSNWDYSGDFYDDECWEKQDDEDINELDNESSEDISEEKDEIIDLYEYIDERIDEDLNEEKENDFIVIDLEDNKNQEKDEKNLEEILDENKELESVKDDFVTEDNTQNPNYKKEILDEIELDSAPEIAVDTIKEKIKDLEDTEILEKIMPKIEESLKDYKDEIDFSFKSKSVYINSSKEDIEKAQKILKDIGLYSGDINGDYNTIIDIVKKYQIDKGIVKNESERWYWYFWPKTKLQIEKDYKEYKNQKLYSSIASIFIENLRRQDVEKQKVVNTPKYIDVRQDYLPEVKEIKWWDKSFWIHYLLMSYLLLALAFYIWYMRIKKNQKPKAIKRSSGRPRKVKPSEK